MTRITKRRAILLYRIKEDMEIKKEENVVSRAEILFPTQSPCSLETLSIFQKKITNIRIFETTEM